MPVFIGAKGNDFRDVNGVNSNAAATLALFALRQNQPRLRKYRYGAIAATTIAASAIQYP